MEELQKKTNEDKIWMFRIILGGEKSSMTGELAQKIHELLQRPLRYIPVLRIQDQSFISKPVPLSALI